MQGGESGASGSTGFSISAHKSIGIPTTVVKETEVSLVPVEEVKKEHKKVYSQANFEASNEITPGANVGVEANANFNANANLQPVSYVKEVSKWRGPQYRTRNFSPIDFQDVMSSLFRIPQGKYNQPMWLIPQHYNYVHQVR